MHNINRTKYYFRTKELTHYLTSSSIIPASTHVPEQVLRAVYGVAEALALALCLRLAALLEPVIKVIS
jgi:hypothetical protein